MANTRGGVLLLGVEDDGIVSGLLGPSEVKKNFWNIINNRSEVSVNLLQAQDVQEIEYAGKKLIAIHIPRASRYQKPIFTGLNPLVGAYKRNHEGDYHCTEREVVRMFSDKSEQSADSQILDRYTIEDLDLDSLHQYRNRFMSCKPGHPWRGQDDQSLLTELGGWRECSQTGQKGVTVAGMLMFGREEVLRYAVPQYSVDYREKLSDDPYVRWTDRIMMDGTWSGNLFQFFMKVIQRLFSDLKVPFQLDSQLFRKGETVVHEAVREALVNALIHADYSGQGGVVIEKYKDRFEFSNSGTLLIRMDEMLAGNISECRNKTLQTMFAMIGIAEKAGSGIDKIRLGWSSKDWRHPIVKERVQPDRVMWTLPMISLLPEESLARLRQRFGVKFQKFTGMEIQVLVTADIEGYVDNARMRQTTTEHSADITKVLQKLVTRGILTQDGQGRWTRYRLANEPSSLHSVGHSIHKEMHCTQTFEALDCETDELITIAESAKKNRRLAYKEMEEILVRLCNGRWLTRKRIAELLERNDIALRSRFLTPMVERGLLSLRYPESPQSTDQAYISNAKKI